MSSLIISILVCLVLNYVVSLLVSLVVPDYYLATMLTSIIIAFIYSLWNVHFDRGHFYKQKGFWMNFFIISIIFLIMDFLVFVI